MRVPWLLALLAALACAPTQGDLEHAGEETGSGRPNVLLIVVDTLRRDRLGCYGGPRDTSPAIDALAASGVRFTNAFSQAPWTTPSIASLLTSRWPSSLGIESETSTLPASAVLVSEDLLEQGYRTAAVVSHSFLSSRWSFDQGFEVFDEANVQGHAATTSVGVAERALELLDGFGGEPFFLFAHFFDPHCAYNEQPDFPFGGRGDYAGPVESGLAYRKLRKHVRDFDTADVAEVLRLYDSEIAFTDAQIGRLLEGLRQRGLEENTLVVLTADHGEEFLDHGNLGHAGSLYQELLGVPLILRGPGVEPGVNARPVPLVDVVPTVHAAVGIEVERALEGQPLFQADGWSSPRVFFAETARTQPLSCVIEGELKLVAHHRMNTYSLYDLHADPGETRSVRSTRTADFERLRPVLDAWSAARAAEREAASRAGDVELSGEDLEGLRALGYAGEDE